MTWDPFGTLAQTLWIGGAQWAGKSTVARLIAARHGITAYHYDYHTIRGHYDRRIAAELASSGTVTELDPEELWIRHAPARMAEDVLAGFPQRFEWTLDDLRGLVSGRPILAEGWGLRPELVAPIAPNLDQMIVMVPTEEFLQHQLAHLDRAKRPPHQVSDPERGQANRIARNRLIDADAVDSAHRLGIRVLEVDGSLDAEGVADLVSAHFARYVSPT